MRRAVRSNVQNQHPKAGRGFTLVELLVVIGIIVLLVGILLPVVNGARRSAWNAASQAQLTRLVSAITAYEQDFRAYPGPLSDDQIINGKALPTMAGGTGGGSLSKVTMPENLVLGLVGGLRPGSATGVYDPERVRNRMGAMSLNPAAPKGYRAYIEVSTSELSFDLAEAAGRRQQSGRFQAEQGGPVADDSLIPEFVDQFPDRLPVLYLRARKGAPGVISVANAPAVYQYDLRHISGYTTPRSGPSGIGGSGPHGLTELGPPQHIQSVAAPEAPWGPPPNGAPPYRALTYFMDPQLNPPTPAPANATATPRQKDGYILISAGKDRVYGTNDDITNFGNVR